MLPERIRAANLPTPIEKLNDSFDARARLYIKRDDLTGAELSGNKIRKLEFSVAQARRQGCDTLITCGGIQSNHCRATAAMAARCGMKSILLLRSESRAYPQGNHLLDLLLGAKIVRVSAKEYAFERQAKMEAIAEELLAEGRKGYIIPEGASNAIGTFGYFLAFEEILEQEKDLGVTFDTIVCAVGSGGTYSGLVFANAAHKAGKKIVGVNICNDAEHFKDVTMGLHPDFAQLLGEPFDLAREDLSLLDGFVGRGYALNTPEEMDFLSDFARRSGILLDPVYTGKAMRGLLTALHSGDPLFQSAQNILFIHTGGLFGLFPKAGEFAL